MTTIDYAVPNINRMQAAESMARTMSAAADRATAAEVKLLADMILGLVADVREMSQAHAEAIERYHALRGRVRDAIAADDFN